MAGTVKTKAQLDADFVTDGSGGITGQNHKNHLASVMGCYGSITKTDLTGSPLTMTSSGLAPFTGFSGANPLDTISASAANGTLTVGAGGDGTYLVGYHSIVAATSATLGENRGEVALSLAKNAGLVGGAAQRHVAYRTARAATVVDASSASGQKVLNVLATTDFDIGETIVIDRAGTVELAQIDTIQAGVSLTLVNNLINTHNGVVVEGRMVGSRATETQLFSGGMTLALVAGDIVSLAGILLGPEATLKFQHATSLWMKRVG